MWYEYSQNNSGGSFIANHYVDQYVYVEADSAKQANERAEYVTMGNIYFDGCEDDRDCPCCGDRWYAIWRDEDGTEEPSHYGEKLSMEIGDKLLNMQYFGANSTIHLYHADGRHEKIEIKEGRIFSIN